MLLEQDIIFILFRVINFFVIVALFVYAFKQYGLPFIRDQIISHKNHIDQLKQNREDKKNALQTTLIAKDQQAIIRQALAEKVIRWQASCSQADNARYTLKELRRVYLTTKAHAQSNALASYSLQKQVFPQTIHLLRTSLQEEMLNEKAHAHYIAHIIDAIKR
jgi:hypothetical protein